MSLVSVEELGALIASGTFDAQWYLREYPDVAMTGLTAEEHYLWIGRALNRQGHPQGLSRPLPMNWCVMTTPHTLFLANMVAANLRRHGWFADVVTEAPPGFPHDHYIVLCPQMFDILPPGERRICYQLEQSVSSRWFTDDYLTILNNSSAVFDYSLRNIEYLSERGISYPHVFYMPIGACYANDRGDQNSSFDLLFYGDYKSSPRRQRLIEGLDSLYSIRLVDEIFGEQVHDLIRQAKFVLNLHYYEGALLEMPRIQECLSLGTPVISEMSKDASDYPQLRDAVTFFEEGSILDMNRVIANSLAEDGNGASVGASVESSQREFEFMFDRFLVARDFLPVSQIETIELPDVFDSGIVGLSLPETVHRRQIFMAEKMDECAVFNGVRKSPSWIGCGMSYKALCHGALKRGKDQITILEDDVLLNEDFARKFATVQRYLKRLDGEWDIFCGVIASLHDDVVVSKVERFEGIDFVTIDKMTSMVFNIYNRWAIQLIANWSPINADVETNAIDRYLETANLKVIVAHPYIAGHREEVHSTLWNFQNTQYAEMILDSQVRLGRMKDAWLAENEPVLRRPAQTRLRA